MTIKIDKGVPIPERKRTTAVGLEHFEVMDVGDSIGVPLPKEYRNKPTVWAGTNRLRNAVYQYAKRTDKKFTVRAMPNEIRVWRVA
jgi:hypothetical protein